MPDLRFGRPSGMVVQGTRVDLLPPRPRWEADAEKGGGVYVCGCGFQRPVKFSLVFERVEHVCRIASRPVGSR